MRQIAWVWMVVLVLVVSGCGGGGGGGASGVTIAGVVSDDPVAGATITLYSFSGARIGTAQSNGVGAFAVVVNPAEIAHGYRVEAVGGTVGGTPFSGAMEAVYSGSDALGEVNVTPLTTLAVSLSAGMPGATPVAKRDAAIGSLVDLGMIAATEWNEVVPPSLNMVAMRASIRAEGLPSWVTRLASEIDAASLTPESVDVFPHAHGGIRVAGLETGSDVVAAFAGEDLSVQITVLAQDAVANYRYAIVNGPIGLDVDDQGLVTFLVPPGAAAGERIPFTLSVAEETTGLGREIDGEIYVMAGQQVLSEVMTPAGQTVVDPTTGIGVEVPAGSIKQSSTITVKTGRTLAGEVVLEADLGAADGEVVLLLPPPAALDTSVPRAGRRTNRTAAAQRHPDLANVWLTQKAYFWGSSRIPEIWDADREVYRLRINAPITRLKLHIKEASELSSAVPRGEVGGKEPVLFIHGYMAAVYGLGGGEETWGDFPEIVAGLELGNRFVPFEFRWRTNARFEDAAADLGRAIEQMYADTGRKVHIVAHSFGGVLIRTYLQGLANTGRPAIRNVASLVTLGTPHSGIFDRDGVSVDGVTFPAGQDSWKFELGGQISMFEMGEPSGLYSGFPDLPAVPGTLAAALAKAENPFPPDLPILSLIGLRHGVHEGEGKLEDGDGLIRFSAQRFLPHLGQGPALTQTAVFGSAIVTERTLNDRDWVLPWSASDGPGYAHTDKSRGSNLGSENLVEANPEGGTTDHASVVEVSAWLLSNKTAPNRAPVLSALENQAGAEGELLSFAVSATDDDGDVLTFSATDLPVGATLDPQSGVFAWTPSFSAANTYTIVFTVTDGELVDSEQITLLVANTNRAPVLDPIGAKTLAEGDAFTFALTGSDPDGESVTFAMANAPTGASLNPATGAFDWTPSASQSGVYSVSFRVTDGDLSDAEVVSLTVTNVNRAPTLDAIGNRSGAEGDALAFSVSAIDPDGGTPSYGVTGLPAGATFDQAAGAFFWTPGYDQAASYPMTFSATDGVASDSETITITIANTNRAPVLHPVGDKTAAEGGQFAFSVNVSDPDGDSQVATVVAKPMPVKATFSRLDLTTWNFAWPLGYSQAGSYPVTFTVTDDDGAIDTETITLTVNNTNRAPVMTPDPIGPKTVREGDVLTFTVSGEDPDGDTLTLSAANLPTGATFAPVTGGSVFQEFSWQPTWAQAGTYSVTIQVADGETAVTEDVLITVTNANRAPVISGAVDTAVDEGDLLSLSISAEDPDGDTVTLSASGLPSWATFDTAMGAPAAQTLSGVPGYMAAGTYQIAFTADDGASPNNTVSIVITVNDIATPEVTSTTPSGSATGVARTSAISATFSTGMDAATINGGTFTLSDGTGPVAGGVTYDSGSATATFTPNSDLAFDTNYTATLTVGVKDLAGIPLAGEQQWSFTTVAVDDTITDPVTGMQFTYVPPGTFTMGDEFGDGWSDETPTHEVTISKGFYLGTYEVTQAQWEAVMGSNPSYFSGNPDHPVETVSWDDVQGFIATLNTANGNGGCVRGEPGCYYLPTEAQWEYAAKGGPAGTATLTKYAGSDTVDDVAWYYDNGYLVNGSTTYPVGTKAPNELGLYDMSGNVYEWVQDWYGAYSAAAVTDPTGPASGSTRVARGGSWYDDAYNVRVAPRLRSSPGLRYSNLGLRLAHE